MASSFDKLRTRPFFLSRRTRTGDGARCRQRALDRGHHLRADHAFLLKGDVFNMDQIEAYMELKWEEVYAFEHTPHPIEFQMYYSV